MAQYRHSDKAADVLFWSRTLNRLAETLEGMRPQPDDPEDALPRDYVVKCMNDLCFSSIKGAIGEKNMNRIPGVMDLTE